MISLYLKMKSNKIIISTFLIFLIIFSQKLFSQADTSKSEIQQFVETSPSYVGGDTARLSFLSSNIIYPKEAFEKPIEGTVYTAFIIEEDGSITDSKIVKDIGGGCGDEVLRVLKIMPKWNPATNNKNEPIRSTYSMSYTFFKTDTVEPSFVGGENARMDFIGKNLIYPYKAKEEGIQGEVFVSFFIEKDGSITNAEIIRDIGGGCGDEVLRVIKLMPRWNPGKIRGKPVKVKYIINTYFILDD